ncbi:MAG: flagellar motor switch protein FliN [Phycisphaerae bacterium]|nr:flagellar motor switch protein FliN [Phycisphaerae bacterium]
MPGETPDKQDGAAVPGEALTSGAESAGGDARQPATTATGDAAAEVATQEAVSGNPGDATAPVVEAKPYSLPSFGEGDATPAREAVDLLSDVELNVSIELGRTQMLVDDVLRLGEGSVVELDKLAGDPVDVYVNDRLVARGEVLVLNDNFCVRVSEIVDADVHD